MKAESTAGRNLDRRATLIVSLTGVIAAAGGAAMFVRPDSWPLGVVCFAAAALPLAARMRRAPGQRARTEGVSVVPPRRSGRSSVARHLDLSDEMPTLRSYVEIIPAGVLGSAPPPTGRPSRIPTLWTILLIAVYGTTIYLLVTHVHEPALLAMAIPATIVAALSIVRVQTRNAHPMRLPATGSKESTVKQFSYSSTPTRSEQQYASAESVREQRRSE